MLFLSAIEMLYPEIHMQRFRCFYQDHSFQYIKLHYPENFSLEIYIPNGPRLGNKVIDFNGVSKAYAMTGYRVGWLLCKNQAFVSACTRLQGQQLTCATMVAQRAAEAALTGPQDCVEEMRQVFAERRKLICRLAREVRGFRFDEPQGAFYLFPDVSAIGKADEVVEYLLNEAHVATVSGSAFGCPSCIRLSYAIFTEEITEAMRRIKNALNR